MNSNLALVETEVYKKCALDISDFKMEPESKEYGACQYHLGGREIISRTAKITPKKVGQFVTFWKRNGDGPIDPFDESDRFDFYVVNVRANEEFGQFVFPKTILLKKGILSTAKKEGKRAFRVYPSWDIVKSKQAERTQKWQLEYFYPLNDSTDLYRVLGLYNTDVKDGKTLNTKPLY
ncbi:MepB family protein [Sediminicola luteus]|uniref:MepB family protein n=1 Tax=Sediminicola luteus TaxID=319238 RepID=A0ABV2U054_9FLAO